MAQTYRYYARNSIIANIQDEYLLTQDEYAILYSFYVTYSMCGNQSAKKRTFADYGWDSENITTIVEHKRIETDLGNALKQIVDFSTNNNFVFTDNDDLALQFSNNNLGDGVLPNYDTERAVIASTSANNKYLKLFYRVRDGFAHGKFALKLASDKTRMVVIQDDNTSNVTARIVIKLSTLIDFIKCVDKQKIIVFETLKTEQPLEKEIEKKHTCVA